MLKQRKFNEKHEKEILLTQLEQIKEWIELEKYELADNETDHFRNAFNKFLWKKGM